MMRIVEYFLAPPGANPAAGMHNASHMAVLLFIFAVITIAIILLRKASLRTVAVILKTLAVIILLSEILKIAYWAVVEGLTRDSIRRWVPLYYCSIFLFALPLAAFGKKHVQTVGLSFLFFSGIVSGFSFLLYPSSSLPEFPMFHFLSLHSLFFHASMVFTGILVFVTGYYRPQIKHALHFSVLTAVFFAAAIAVNSAYEANMMFLSSPFGIPALEKLYDLSPLLYRVIFAAGQFILPFAVSATVYSIIKHRPAHKPQAEAKTARM